MAKVTLHHVRGNSFFCSGRLSIGVYVNNNVALLIDSGIDRETAKSVNQTLVEAGYTVGAIINTHHHPDHCTGNAFFQKMYPNLKIYTTEYEKIFIENPHIGPIAFCCGACPFSGIRSKFLEAEASIITNTIEHYHDQTISIFGQEFKIITLPGHTPGSIGIITPDNVLYCGDAFFGEETLNKHGLLFYTKIDDSLASLKKLETLQIDACVFYHGGIAQEIASVARHHEERILKTKQAMLSLLPPASSFSMDQLVQAVMLHYKIPENITQFILTRTAVHAYVAQLELEKQIELVVQEGLLQIKVIERVCPL